MSGSEKILNYTKKRYIGFFIITALVLLMPFLRINGNHLFLLSFDKKELHLFFTAFSTQELYLMPFCLILFFLFIFFITTLAGRIWCGWGCPQTIFRTIYRDLIQTKLLGIRKNIANKQQESEKGFKSVLAVVIFFFIALVAASNLLWFFVPPEDFFAYIKNPSEHKLLVGIVLGFTIFLTFLVTFLKEKFCVYVCPYARVQSTMFDNDTVQVIYDEKRGGKIYDESKNLIANKPQNGDCTGCQSCVRICPTHIDIRKGMQLDCINCLECADACSNTMSKLGKKSLISWTSENSVETGNKVKFFRFRTIGYIVVLCIVFIALMLMSTKKENMLLNINRTTELYSISFDNDDLRVINDYTFMFQNTDKKEHSYFFEVDNPGIEILKPKEAIKVGAGAKRRTVVRLVTKQDLANGQNERKDLIIPIVIKAYATDDKENIAITRKTIFSYPKQEVIEAKKAEK